MPGFSFALNGYRWPDGTQIAMHLQLTHVSGALQDGSASWNASAADALSIWNQYIDTVQFAAAEPSGSSGSDGANEVLFSSTVYGDSWPANVLAVTLKMSSEGSVFTETDVLFNDKLKWNSYRGPLQGSGPTGTYDFHRVALHEFGHVLGLDHPDQHGQTVIAQMNSIVSDLDHLADDDIAGGQALYGKAKLTAYLGANFQYQVTPANAGTYSAVDLPPGLAIDSASGLISGVATISGTYSVEVTVNKSTGSSTITLQIIVTAPITNSSPGGFLKKLDLNVSRLAADPSRPRIYATVPASNSVAIIDSNTLEVIKMISVAANPIGLAVSTDHSKLWVACNGSTAEAIGVIDLATLQALPSLAAPFPPYDVEEGLENRLYVTSENHGIMKIDGKTGAFGGTFYGASFVEISPDRKTLFVAARGVSPSYITKFDVSTPTPVLQQNAFGNGLDLKLSPTGEFICFFIGSSNGSGPSNTLRTPTSNLSTSSGFFDGGGGAGPTAWSGDGTVLYESFNSKTTIALFDTNTLARVGQISIGAAPSDGGGYFTRDLVVDNSGSRLFVATSSYPSNADLRVFDTGRTNLLPTAPPSPKSLLNVSTRLRVQAQDNALIGGVIIQGSDPKKIVVRAIGPSIPVSNRLADPTLVLYDSTGHVIASNDNWNSARQPVLDTRLAPADEHEAVIVTTLAAGAYTVVVRGVNDTTGVGLVEIYDIDSSHSRVANISTRGKVESGDNVMIGGFIVGGDQATKVIVRGIGPSLIANGVVNALPDPVLELHDGNGSLITQNDDWRSLQEDAITQTGIAPKDDRESAIVATLQAGNYTAILRGKDDVVGVGLVEIYNLDSN